MLGDYLPILLTIALAAIICTVMVTASWFFGPKRKTSYKGSPYECGVTPLGSARQRFPIHFYLVAILFVLFDVEVVFLWSWLTVFKDPFSKVAERTPLAEQMAANGAAVDTQFAIFTGP